MQKFQSTFETRKQSFISAFSIYMAVPLSISVSRTEINIWNKFYKYQKNFLEYWYWPQNTFRFSKWTIRNNSSVLVLSFQHWIIFILKYFKHKYSKRKRSSQHKESWGRPLKVLASGNYKGPLGDQYKIWWFNEKIVF